MRKIALIFLVMLIASGIGFAQDKEKIQIPKTGILEVPIDTGKGNLIVYRDEAVLVGTKSDVKTSSIGNFLMEVHVMPTVPLTKNVGWDAYINNVCAAWTNDKGRLSVAPIRVGEVVFNVEINETDATCRIYGISLYEHRKNGNTIQLHSAVESAKTRFHTVFEPLKDAIFFDAAYRKIVQYHKGY